jgi:hypothetical protein
MAIIILLLKDYAMYVCIHLFPYEEFPITFFFRRNLMETTIWLHDCFDPVCFQGKRNNLLGNANEAAHPCAKMAHQRS